MADNNSVRKALGGEPPAKRVSTGNQALSAAAAAAEKAADAAEAAAAEIAAEGAVRAARAAEAAAATRAAADAAKAAEAAAAAAEAAATAPKSIVDDDSVSVDDDDDEPAAAAPATPATEAKGKSPTTPGRKFGGKPWPSVMMEAFVACRIEGRDPSDEADVGCDPAAFIPLYPTLSPANTKLTNATEGGARGMPVILKHLRSLPERRGTVQNTAKRQLDEEFPGWEDGNGQISMDDLGRMQRFISLKKKCEKANAALHCKEDMIAAIMKKVEVWKQWVFYGEGEKIDHM